MASFKLTVTVRDGKTPKPIHVDFIKNGEHFISFDSAMGFDDHPFDNLGPGQYHLFIIGLNPSNGEGSTECKLTLDGIELNQFSDPNPSKTKPGSVGYRFEYHFAI